MSRQDVIRANKRRQFQQRQQTNRIRSQLNQLQQAGFSQDQIRAAGPQAFQALAGTNPGQVVVSDGDTISSIAQKNNTTEADLLAANPELKSVRTGMVIKTPAMTPGGPGWQGAAITDGGGIGLPSNAALGGTTTNPQGNNGFDERRGRGFSTASRFMQDQQYRPPTYLQTLEENRRKQQQAVRGLLTRDAPYPGIANAAEQRRYPLYANNTAPQQRSSYPLYADNAVANRKRGPYPLYAGNTPPSPSDPYPLYAEGALAMQARNDAAARQSPATTVNPAVSAMQTPAIQTPAAFMPGYQYMSRTLFHNQLRTKIEQGHVPSEGELNILERMGFIKKNSSPSGGGFGGFSYRRRGGGGGGGRGGGGGGGSSFGQPREPAFSTGGGGFGLINWRI